MLNYPLTCNPQDMLLTQQTNQMKHMFCGDVMARGLYLGYAKWYLREHGITVAMHPDDAEALKRGTVDFYVFSYYMTNCCGRNPDAEKTAANICSDIMPSGTKEKIAAGHFSEAIRKWCVPIQLSAPVLFHCHSCSTQEGLWAGLPRPKCSEAAVKRRVSVVLRLLSSMHRRRRHG